MWGSMCKFRCYNLYYKLGQSQKKTFLDVDEPISEAQKNSLVSLYNGDQGLFMFLLEISNNWENNVYHESV